VQTRRQHRADRLLEALALAYKVSSELKGILAAGAGAVLKSLSCVSSNRDTNACRTDRSSALARASAVAQEVCGLQRLLAASRKDVMLRVYLDFAAPDVSAAVEVVLMITSPTALPSCVIVTR